MTFALSSVQGIDSTTPLKGILPSSPQRQGRAGRDSLATELRGMNAQPVCVRWAHAFEPGALILAMSKQLWLAACAALAFAPIVRAESVVNIFHDVELEARLRQTQVDAGAPEPSGFTSLDMAPFHTAQTLSPSDLSFSMAQTFDGSGQKRFALAADLTTLQLLRGRWRGERWHLSDYKGHHNHRTIARAQLSIAMSKGESDRDQSLRIAPAVRVVLHQERDPRVHRGTGSLQDCFERNVGLAEDQRDATDALGRRLDAADMVLADPASGAAARAAARRELAILQPQWEEAVEQYRKALRELVRKGMAVCREDPELAAYAWNSTGYAVGASPTLRASNGAVDDLGLHGYSVWATASYGFDPHGRVRDWTPTFLGRHAQVMLQLTYRHDQLLLRPGGQASSDEANQYAASTRVRFGKSRLNGSLEFALLHDDFDVGAEDTYTAMTIGADMRLHEGVWLSASLGRTISREKIPEETSLRLSLQWSKF